MKPTSYYQKTSVAFPNKEDYMTIYYYRKGVMVGMKVGKIDEEFEPPKNCVEEKVLDEVSYQSHLNHYHEELKRLQDEFKNDLIEKYNMTGHPKAEECFYKAWDFGESSGLYDVQDYFMNLVELVKDSNETPIFHYKDPITGLDVF